MDIKHLVTGLVGFTIGLTINLAVDLESIWQTSDSPAHVKRYQYLMSFESHQVDPEWATKLESKFSSAFEHTSHLRLSYVKCYSDICAFEVKELDSSKHAVKKDWETINHLLPEPSLIGHKEIFERSGKRRNLILYQFPTS